MMLRESDLAWRLRKDLYCFKCLQRTMTVKMLENLFEEERKSINKYFLQFLSIFRFCVLFSSLK